MRFGLSACPSGIRVLTGCPSTKAPTQDLPLTSATVQASAQPEDWRWPDPENVLCLGFAWSSNFSNPCAAPCRQRQGTGTRTLLRRVCPCPRPGQIRRAVGRSRRRGQSQGDADPLRPMRPACITRIPTPNIHPISLAYRQKPLCPAGWMTQWNADRPRSQVRAVLARPQLRQGGCRARQRPRNRCRRGDRRRVRPGTETPRSQRHPFRPCDPEANQVAGHQGEVAALACFL